MRGVSTILLLILYVVCKVSEGGLLDEDDDPGYIFRPVPECNWRKGEIREWVWSKMYCCDPAKKNRQGKHFDQCRLIRTAKDNLTPIWSHITTRYPVNGTCYWNYDYSLGDECPKGEQVIAWSHLNDGGGNKKFCCKVPKLSAKDNAKHLKKLNCHWERPTTNRFVQCSLDFRDFFRQHFEVNRRGFLGLSDSWEWNTDLLCCK